MSYEEALKTISVEASTDLSANQYYMVDVDANGQLVLAGAGTKMIGVLQDKPAATGRVGAVGIDGVSKVSASAAIAAGARVASTAGGQAVTAVSGNYSLGEAMEAATAAGDIIAVKIDIVHIN